MPCIAGVITSLYNPFRHLGFVAGQRKHSVNRSVLRPVVAVRALCPWSDRRHDDGPASGDGLPGDRVTMCPRRPLHRPATSNGARLHSGSTARSAPHPRAPHHLPRHTPSGTPSTTTAGSTATGTTSATTRTASPPNDRPTPPPTRSSSSAPPPAHAAPALPCCCPSALPGAPRTPSNPSSAPPGSLAPAAGPGATGGPPTLTPLARPRPLPPHARARPLPRTPPAPPGPPGARR